jgi:DNA-binding transcriptional LysR family regulator
MKISGYKKNKLQQIRGFCTVIEEGSILQASKKMNTAQSNVSLQISSLEKTLGISLFKREKQRLSPTAEALRFYKICTKTLNEVDFLFEYVGKTIKDDYDNVIKLAGHTYMLSHILPPYFQKMIEINPEVKFELHNSNYEEAMDMLKAGIVDFLVFPADLKNLPPNIEKTEFYKCKAAIIMSKNHPLAETPAEKITWDLLIKYDFLTLGKGVTAQNLKQIIRDNTVSSRFTLHNGTWEICVGIANEGLVITGSDYQYLEKLYNNKNLIVKRCSWLLPEYEFFILTNNKSIISKSSSDFLKLLK